MATNIRIIYNNAIDRANLSASSAAGSLVASNMAMDIKSAVWRSLATSETITATWGAGEVVSGVILPFCNLTTNATIRVRGYANVDDTGTVLDTGAVVACPASQPGLWGWNASMGVNAFAYGGGTYARVWLATPVTVKKLVIDIADAGNTAGYLEVSRLVVGQHWEPKIGAEQGATLTVVDTGKHYRTDGGDLMTDTGTKYRKQSFSLPSLDESDRAKMWDILWGNGMARPLFISMYPNNADSQLEQTHQLYGKLVSTPIMNTPYFNRHSATIDIEEV